MKVKIHQESTHTLDHHFRDKQSDMSPLFDTLIEKLSKDLDFDSKSAKFQKERWAQYVEIKKPEDIDQELIDWIKFSYE